MIRLAKWRKQWASITGCAWSFSCIVICMRVRLQVHSHVCLRLYPLCSARLRVPVCLCVFVCVCV